VSCVSAAVSDESVAGDSGVYEASVQRWVAEGLLGVHGRCEHTAQAPEGEEDEGGHFQ
jgi:hypothetical protein